MNKRFSIILLNYNQEQYIDEALDSVIEQTYKDYELIIIDDCSINFPKEKIEKKLKKAHISDYKIVINDENLGTVKTLNKSLDLVNGDYVLFFAADDKLYDNKVIENYVRTFALIDDSYDTVSFQSYMCGTTLDGDSYHFVGDYYASRINSYNSKQLFNEMSKGCLFPSGATAYKRELFNKVGKFDERYRLIEDWPFYLKCSRLGIKMYFKQIGGLKHRSGGVSHYDFDNLPPHIVQYYKDLYYIYKYEVIPYFMRFDLNAKLIALKEYDVNYKRCKLNDKKPLIYKLYLLAKKVKKGYEYLNSLVTSMKFLLLNIVFLEMIYINNVHVQYINYYCIVLMIIIMLKYILRFLKKIFKFFYKIKSKIKK